MGERGILLSYVLDEASKIYRPYLSIDSENYKAYKKLLKKERKIRNTHPFFLENVEKEEVIAALRHNYYLHLLDHEFSFEYIQNVIATEIEANPDKNELLQTELTALQRAYEEFSTGEIIEMPLPPTLAKRYAEKLAQRRIF